jgi:hypothetical protein
METEEFEIIIHSADRSEMEELSSILNTEVSEIGGKVRFAPADPKNVQPGEMGMGVDWNNLLITLLASGGAVVSIINMIGARVNQTTSITVKREKGKEEFTFTGPLTSRNRQMVEKFLTPDKKK